MVVGVVIVVVGVAILAAGVGLVVLLNLWRHLNCSLRLSIDCVGVVVVVFGVVGDGVAVGDVVVVLAVAAVMVHFKKWRTSWGSSPARLETDRNPEGGGPVRIF